MPILQSIRHMRRTAILSTVLIIVAATGSAMHLGAAHREASLRPAGDASVVWTDADWNLPLDNWGQGRAWHATGPGGAGLRLFARTKSGFCNCFNGIADDVEIDRIGDVDLHGDSFAATAPGAATSVGDLPGRKRSFRASNRWSGTNYVLSIVAATDCKAVVATIVSDQAIPPAAEASAVALLTGETFRRWAADQ